MLENLSNFAEKLDFFFILTLESSLVSDMFVAKDLSRCSQPVPLFMYFL